MGAMEWLTGCTQVVSAGDAEVVAGSADECRELSSGGRVRTVTLPR